MNYKEKLDDYLRIINLQADSKIRSREFKEFGYGNFVFTETPDEECWDFKVSYKQQGYREANLLRKRFYKSLGTEEEFRAQFYKDVLHFFVMGRPMKMKSFTTYEFRDLINKGLPDEEKIENGRITQ